MSNPSKEQVKRWIEDRAKEHKPLPSQADIRRQMGWDLIDSNKKQLNPDPQQPNGFF
jgi:hypothetical protein